MDFTDSLPLHSRRAATRSSLACLPCRSSHRKCDGTRPHCSRCVEAATQCHYAKSRRGGLDRAALAERRKQLAAASQGSSTDGQDKSQTCSCTGANVEDQHDNDQTYGSGPSSTVSSASLPVLPCNTNITHDPLIDSYYKNFHKFHPMVLPKTHLARLFQDPTRQPSLTPLLAVLRFIGHLYHTREWSTPLQDSVDVCLSQAPQTDPFMVQCRLLYSIALFWHGHSADSKREMDAAIQLGLHLEIFRQEFAAEHGGGDTVLTESWRRTWWMLYVVDGYYTGTLGTMAPAFVDVEATVDLPCEEAEFESGVSPP